MLVVNPIKELKQIEWIKNQLKGADKIRDLVLFELGINSALRISDLLKTQVCDVFDENLNPKESFTLKEQKTHKNGIVYITPKVAESLKLYKEKYPSVVTNPQNYIFFRQKRFDSKTETIWTNHISPNMAWRLVSEWCSNIGLKGNYGTHTMRKTRGYQARMKGVAMELLQFRLNHSSMSVTKKYLGISDSELQKVCLEMDL